MSRYRKHSWVWPKWSRWFPMRWRYRLCLHCAAKLRLEPRGPRGGKRYSYQGPGDKAWATAKRLPACGFSMAAWQLEGRVRPSQPVESQPLQRTLL